MAEPPRNQTQPAESPLSRTFAALRHRGFRLYWSGNTVSLIGVWMQNIARAWLVLQLTNSPFMVGLEATVSRLPIWLFSLPAGVLADRYSKRNLLLIGQSLQAVLALALAVLAFTGVINIYHILIISGLTGCIIAVNAPVRHSILPELVGKKDLLNAVALNAAVWNGARIIGPSIAGVALGVIGAGGCFAINSASFLTVIIALAFIHIKPVSTEPEKESVWQRIVTGLRFVKAHKDIRVLMVMAAVFSSFGIVYLPLMPVFAKDVFNAGPKGYGIMMAAVGVGALTGLLVLATISKTRHKGLILVFGTLVLSVLLIAFSLVRNFTIGIAVMVGMGFSQSITASLTNTLIQTLAPDHIRGRVMSIFTLCFLGMFPLGSLLGGAIAQKFGAPASTLLGGCAILISLVLVNLLRSQIRRL